MAFQIPIEQLQEAILEALKNELGKAWDEIPEEQRDLVVRAATNYAKQHLYLIIAEVFKGIDVEETKANIKQIEAQLLAIGASLQIKVVAALNKAIAAALKALLAQLAAGNLPAGT